MERYVPRFRERIESSARRSVGSEKLFGKYDDLVRLVLGFVFTGIVGTYLSHRYTTQQADLVAAGKVFSDHSRLIGDRYFAMNQVTVFLRDVQKAEQRKSSSDLEIKWRAYVNVLQQWNSARGFNREMIKLYFGDPLWSMERDVHYQFRAWGQALELDYKTPGAIDFKCLAFKTDELLENIHSLQTEMARAMQGGKVGASRDRLAVNPSDRPAPFCPMPETTTAPTDRLR